MNRHMLLKLHGKRVAIRPKARRYDEDGLELEQLDGAWLVQEVSRQRIVFRHAQVDCDLPLGTDHVREYLTDQTGKTDGF